MTERHSLFFLFFCTAFSLLGCSGKEAPSDTVQGRAKAKPVTKPEKPPEPNITVKDLLKTTVTLTGRWEEKDLFVNDKGQWHCSGVVRREEHGVLHIVTNRHCLGLEGLSKSEALGMALDVLEYRILVHTHNGKELEVAGLDMQTDLDLAMLRTRPAALSAGRDFLVAPVDPVRNVDLGESVIAVGTPLDPRFSGTMTFGRVSALREENRMIQHDAAINHGNSGGPLFVSRGIDHFWVGVNTTTVDKKIGEGLHFAISVREIGNGPTITVTADPAGACRLIRHVYSKGCRVVN